MRWRETILMLLIPAMLLGCQPRNDMRVGRADAEVLAEVRGELAQRDPGALVGIVTEVLPADRYAAVRDVPLEEFQLGDTITFIDATQRPLVHGHVRRITSTELHVRYYPPGRGERSPRVGDLAVRFQ